MGILTVVQLLTVSVCLVHTATVSTLEDLSDENASSGECIRLDGALSYQDKKYLFVGEKYIQLDGNNEEISVKSSKLGWGGLGAIDGAVSRHGFSYFFKDRVYYFYAWFFGVLGPYPISKWGEGLKNGVDAAASLAGRSFFAKGCDYFVYDYNYYQGPYSLEDEGVDCDLDAALNLEDGSISWVKDDRMWFMSTNGTFSEPVDANDVFSLKAGRLCGSNETSVSLPDEKGRETQKEKEDDKVEEKNASEESVEKHHLVEAHEDFEKMSQELLTRLTDVKELQKDILRAIKQNHDDDSSDDSDNSSSYSSDDDSDSNSYSSDDDSDSNSYSSDDDSDSNSYSSDDDSDDDSSSYSSDDDSDDANDNSSSSSEYDSLSDEYLEKLKKRYRELKYNHHGKHEQSKEQEKERIQQILEQAKERKQRTKEQEKERIEQILEQAKERKQRTKEQEKERIEQIQQYKEQEIERLKNLLEHKKYELTKLMDKLQGKLHLS